MSNTAYPLSVVITNKLWTENVERSKRGHPREDALQQSLGALAELGAWTGAILATVRFFVSRLEWRLAFLLQRVSDEKIELCIFNTLRTGDIDLRFYITTVKTDDANMRF
jgi:hypothetical protein